MMKNMFTYGLSFFLLTGCAVFGIRSAEEAPYTILLQEDIFQIRQYDDLIVAETTVQGGYDSSGSESFRRLAGYIFGKNSRKEKIAMTAPVLQEEEGEKIPMTAPVLMEQSGKKWTMSFVMPSEYTLETLPDPLDADVVIRILPGRKVAVIRYSGYLREEKITVKALELQRWLEKKGHTPLSGPRSAGYDPPWTIPFLRKNEVHIDIK